MANNYSIWGTGPVEDNCVLGQLKGYDDSWELTEGTSLSKKWHDDVTFRMSKDYPRNTVVTDCLTNIDNVIVGSEKLRKFLEAEKVTGLEFLPVNIINHKGKKIPEPYWIVNPVKAVDCIDKKKSKLEMSMIDETVIDSISKLVIDETKIPGKRNLFRVAQSAELILASSDLTKRIDSAGLSNIVWGSIAKFRL